jgi:hypothetical protein
MDEKLFYSETSIQLPQLTPNPSRLDYAQYQATRRLGGNSYKYSTGREIIICMEKAPAHYGLQDFFYIFMTDAGHHSLTSKQT